jgi:leucyl aminopeptidase
VSRHCLIEPESQATLIIPLQQSELASWLSHQSSEVCQWVHRCGFDAAAHSVLHVPGPTPLVLLGLGATPDRWSFAGLPMQLPEANYRLPDGMSLDQATRAALGWALGAYQFTYYKSAQRAPARLCWPMQVDRAAVTRSANAVALARDLINTPAADMGPSELACVAEVLADEVGGSYHAIDGAALLDAGYPLIHALGRASAFAPRLIDLRWGDPAAPKVTLVGKGVCFDTGGLNLKSAGSMLSMKVDMAGAAHALALARMIMEAGLRLRLRVLVPAIENSIGGNAVRPLDILRSRKGLTVEIVDTDAEGRLVLADALCEASREGPDLLIDFATLTSSARTALGPDVAAMFSNDDALAAHLEQTARINEEPLWRLPLWQPYARDIEGKQADLANVADLNIGSAPRADAIHAALFLQRFVEPGTKWVHLDIFGCNLRSRPGRPEGGEACNLLALFQLIEEWCLLSE